MNTPEPAENPQPATPTPSATDHAARTAADLVAGIRDQVAIAPGQPKATAQPAPAPAATAGAGGAVPTWALEPVRNFKLDDRGKVKLRDDGTPVRKAGRKFKPRPGELLANGEHYKPAGWAAPPGPDPAHRSSASRSSGGGGVSAVALPPGMAGPAAAQPLGEDAASVFADGVFNSLDALAGEDYAPTAKERAAIDRAAGSALGGLRVSGKFALVVLVICYVGRVVVQTLRRRQTAEQDNKQPHSTDQRHAEPRATAPRADRRPDPDRQEPHRQADRGGIDLIGDPSAGVRPDEPDGRP